MAKPQTIRAALAVFPLFFRPARFVEIARIDTLALNLESADFQRMFAEGKWPTSAAFEDWDRKAETWRTQLLKNFATSFLVSALMGVAAATAYLMLAPHASFTAAKALAGVGAVLMAWSGVLSMLPTYESFSGRTLPERIRPLLVAALLIAGGSTALLGALW